MMTAWDMWNHRNKALHEEEANKQAILEDAVNKKIRDTYQQGRALLPFNARSLMKRPLAKLLQFPEHYKRQWIASVEAAKAQFTRLGHNPARKERRTMTRYICQMANL